MISYTNCILLAENGCTSFRSREFINKNNAKLLDTPKSLTGMYERNYDLPHKKISNSNRYVKL